MTREAKSFTATRQVTGPAYHHAYVYRGNKVVRSCTHKHRSVRTAQRCADAMYRDLMRLRAGLDA